MFEQLERARYSARATTIMLTCSVLLLVIGVIGLLIKPRFIHFQNLGIGILLLAVTLSRRARGKSAD